MSALSPVPKIVRTSPAGTCAARKLSARMLNSSENSAPPIMPPRDPDRRASGFHRESEAADGADEHHALDAEVEHAGFLDDEFPGGGQKQRRRRDDDAENDVGQDEE